MEYRVLGGTGLRVSRLGFGASPLGNEFGAVDPVECTRAVQAAIDQGINFFDTSPYYGRTLSESRLGEALGTRRREVVLASKCGRYDVRGFDFSAGRIAASVDESLARLRTDYIDLWQAHDIEFGDRRQIIEETVPAMREVQRQGKVRFIGITGYQLRMLRAVAEEVAVDSVLSYCRYNLLIDDMDAVLTPLVASRGIGLVNASPLHMGVLTNGGAPSWHPAPVEVIEAGSRAAALCRERGADISSVALRYCLEHPYAATTLIGMSTVAQVEANLRAEATPIDPQLLADLRALLAPVKDRTWPSGREENSDAH